MSAKATVLVLTPTPGEFQGVSGALGKLRARNFSLAILESGPGKINAAMKAAEAISAAKGQGAPLILAGVGTSGSLTLSAACGDVVASRESLVADWRHEDGKETLVGPYGAFDYGPPDEARVGAMVIREEDPLIAGLVGGLTQNGFLGGRILTSDCFVAGRDHKLALGALYGATVCDMESAAFAFVARALGARCLNLRVVADTLDETLEDYFRKELDVTARLGERALDALSALDGLLG
jgi:nucleoside phosphorylase